MKKIYLLLILGFLTSCNSIDTYLKSKNLVTSKDYVKYKVIYQENEKLNEENIVKKENTRSDDEIKKSIIKSESNRLPVIKKDNPKVSSELKTTVIKTEIKKMQEETKTETTEVPVIKSNDLDVKFDKTDEQIIEYIAKKVVENEKQIKIKTIESIKILNSKGINLTVKEFLAKVYENIKKSNVSSYILAVARVMNKIESETKK